MDIHTQKDRVPTIIPKKSIDSYSWSNTIAGVQDTVVGTADIDRKCGFPTSMFNDPQQIDSNASCYMVPCRARYTDYKANHDGKKIGERTEMLPIGNNQGTCPQVNPPDDTLSVGYFGLQASTALLEIYAALDQLRCVNCLRTALLPVHHLTARE